MKSARFFVSFVAICFQITVLNAVTRTVDNQGSGQFATIEAAVVASSPKDTILIAGSPYAYYPTPVVKDSLTFIGPGFNPQKQNPSTAVIGNYIAVGVKNTFIGMVITGIGSTSGSLYDLTLIRCTLGGLMSLDEYKYYSNLVLDGCIVTANSLFRSNQNSNNPRWVSGAVLRNCLFYNCALVVHTFASVSNVLVENCVFYSNSPIHILSPIPANSPISLTNNILVNASALFTGAGFNHNFSTVEDLNVNGGANNLQGTSPGFVNAAGGTFNFSHNYHLANGSPCIGTGSNGTDMGIYGGSNPVHWDGVSVLPQIQYFNVLGSQVNQGGNLKVTFQALIKD